MKRTALILAVALGLLPIACGLDGSDVEDSEENRALQADRYLEAAPISEMMEDMAAQVSRTLPPEQQAMFKAMFTKHLDLDALNRASKEIMVKHFTAGELGALADFYGSPVGKAAMKKFGVYMAEAMPSIQMEMAKAQQKARREMSAGS